MRAFKNIRCFTTWKSQMLWQFQLRSKNTFRTIESLRDSHSELDVIKNLHTLTALRAGDATRASAVYLL